MEELTAFHQVAPMSFLIIFYVFSLFTLYLFVDTCMMISNKITRKYFEYKYEKTRKEAVKWIQIGRSKSHE